jgi:hypothetical protein
MRRVRLPSRFTHDLVRTQDRAYVCNTGQGQIIELEFPSMNLVGSRAAAGRQPGGSQQRCQASAEQHSFGAAAARPGFHNAHQGGAEVPRSRCAKHTGAPAATAQARPGRHVLPPALQLRTMPLFTLKEHPNTLAPLADGEIWAVLHNLGEVRPLHASCAPGPRQLRARSPPACMRASFTPACSPLPPPPHHQQPSHVPPHVRCRATWCAWMCRAIRPRSRCAFEG